MNINQASPIHYNKYDTLSSTGKTSLMCDFGCSDKEFNKKDRHVVIHQAPPTRTSMPRINTPNKTQRKSIAHRNRPHTTIGPVIFDPSSTFFRASLPCGEHTTLGMAYIAGQDPTFYEEDPRNLTTTRPITTMGVRDKYEEFARYSKFEPIDDNTRRRRSDWNEVQLNHDTEVYKQSLADTVALNYYDPTISNPYNIALERNEEMRHKKVGIEMKKNHDDKSKNHKTNLVPISQWIAAHTRNQIKDTIEKRKEQTQIEQERLKRLEDRQMELISQHQSAMQKKKEDAEAEAKRKEDEKLAKKEAKLQKKLEKLTPWQREDYLKKLRAREAKKAAAAALG